MIFPRSQLLNLLKALIYKRQVKNLHQVQIIHESKEKSVLNILNIELFQLYEKLVFH